jgi:hypothetical protein
MVILVLTLIVKRNVAKSKVIKKIFFYMKFIILLKKVYHVEKITKTVVFQTNVFLISMVTFVAKEYLLQTVLQPEFEIKYIQLTLNLDIKIRYKKIDRAEILISFNHFFIPQKTN